MLALLSPAKALDFDTPPTTQTNTQPDFLNDSQLLINQLKKLTVSDVIQLMDLSEKLAQLNVNRFHAWHTPFTVDQAKQAILAFNGDVYEGLNATSFSQTELEYAQQHIGILSGLYGLLRPLDLIQPYRLEMGTKFQNTRGKNLYEFWGDTITNAINQWIAKDKHKMIINLASDEYFKSVKPKKLIAPVINCVFKDEKNGQFKIISFYAKRARGLMAKFIIEKKPNSLVALQKFSAEGYQYDAKNSTDHTLVFCRSETAIQSLKN